MSNSENNFRYDTITRSLHWISAAIILWALLSGFIIFNVVDNPDVLHFTSKLNVSLTLLLIPIFAFRIINKIYISRKQGAQDHNHFLAHFAHTCIYIITTFILVSGVLMIEGEVVFFGVSLFSNELEASLTSFFEHSHSIACQILGGLVLLHILAVIKHQLMGDKIILRMI